MDIKKLRMIIMTTLLCIINFTQIIYAEVYGSISGRVYDEQTKMSIADCLIEAFNGTNLESITKDNLYEKLNIGEIKLIETSVSDKNGNFAISRLRPGKYLIKFIYHYKDELKYSTEDMQIITLLEGKNIVDYDFKLIKLGSISGKIYTKDGNGHPPKLQAIWAYDGKKSYMTLPRNFGEFIIDALPSYSKWQVYICYTGHIYTYETTLDTSGSKDLKDIKIIVKENNPTGIIGKITTPDGTPLKNSFIYFTLENEIFTGNAELDSTGNYSIDGLPQGKYYPEIIRDNLKKIFYKNPVIVIDGQKIESNYVYDSTLESKLEMPSLFFSEEEGYKQCSDLYVPDARQKEFCEKSGAVAYTRCILGGGTKIKKCDKYYNNYNACEQGCIDDHEAIHQGQLSSWKLCNEAIGLRYRCNFIITKNFEFEDDANKKTQPCWDKCKKEKKDHDDGGDESYFVSDPVYPNTIYYSQTPDVSILTNRTGNDFSNEFSALIGSFKRSNIFNDFDFDPLQLKTHAPILLIPEAGFFGLEKSEIFKASLREFTAQGGIIICLTQQHGYEYSALPVPDGEKSVMGYGFREDMSCQISACEIQDWHNALSGQSKAVLDINTDGYLTSWPESAKVLLRRTKNGQPTGIMYKVGSGYVFILSTYEDYAYAISQSTQSGRNLIRDIITWAKNPVEMAEYRPGSSINIPITITNKTDKESVSASVNILTPDGVEKQKIPLNLPLQKGETGQYTYTGTAGQEHRSDEERTITAKYFFPHHYLEYKLWHVIPDIFYRGSNLNSRKLKT